MVKPVPESVPKVPVKREKRRIIAVAVALIGLVPDAAVAPVIFARTVCPATRSFPLLNPVDETGNPGCPVKIPKSTRKEGAVNVRHTPVPNPALANGEPLVVIELSLRIIPMLVFPAPLQVLG